MSDKPRAPAAERNAPAILDVVREELKHAATLLEIGSGTGQHAVCFAAKLPQLEWQPSEVAENLDGIRAWLQDAALSNVADPVVLDVLVSTVPDAAYDAVFTANTAHIMSYRAVEKMMELVAATLNPDGRFLLYGPLRQNGQFNTQSNAAFDASLRRRNAGMGIRDLEDLDRMAAAGGMRRVRLYAMPTNNQFVVWQKRGNQ